MKKFLLQRAKIDGADRHDIKLSSVWETIEEATCWGEAAYELVELINDEDDFKTLDIMNYWIRIMEIEEIEK